MTTCQLIIASNRDVKDPELVIRKHGDGTPIAGGCSACPDVRFDLALISSKEQNLRMLEAMFQIHFQKVHLSPGEMAIHFGGLKRTDENTRKR